MRNALKNAIFQCCLSLCQEDASVADESIINQQKEILHRAGYERLRNRASCHTPRPAT
jgi:hypothetical protein